MEITGLPWWFSDKDLLANMGDMGLNPLIWEGIPSCHRATRQCVLTIEPVL